MPDMSDLLGMLQSAFSTLREMPGRLAMPMPMPTQTSTPAPYTEHDVETLARTAWGEARGEGDEGIQAVLHVIKNRKLSEGGDTSYSDIALRPKQFSVWNQGDPNLEKVKALPPEKLSEYKQIVENVLSGESEDPTGGARYYHNVNASPSWAQGAKPTTTIGRHVFYDEL